MRLLILLGTLFALAACDAPTVAEEDSALAAGDPVHERHELMEGVRDAAKPIGQMLKGEADYDAATVMTSLQTFQDASLVFGDLFPAGSEAFETSEAAPAIWEDRDGFNEALATWQEAVNAAVAAAPQTLDEAKPTVGPIFKTCKNCHDTYRIEKE
jgi:cytochrome c556